MTMNGEEQTISKAQHGDRCAMHEIYNAHAAYLFAVCTRYVADNDSAKDVMQEAFIRIFSNITQFRYRGEGTLRAWMTRIVVNEALKHIRRNSIFYDTDIEKIDMPDEEETDIHGVPPDDIHDIIRQLPDGYRTVLNLFVFEQKSHKEIAKMLGISELTSASQYHRAKKLLKKLVKEHIRT